MSGVEAVRVMAVLDDAAEGLRLLSHVSAPPFGDPQHLNDLLGAKLSSAEAKLVALGAERSDAMLRIVKLFQDVRDFGHRRLTTTVEEDKSVQEHFEDVKIREEKALSEKAQLQQKLKLDRLQRQRQAGLMQKQADGAAAHLSSLTAAHATCMHSMQGTAEAETGSALGAYSQRKAVLQSTAAAARSTLAQLRTEHADAEASSRKLKRKAGIDVEAAIEEYDREAAERHGALATEQAALADLVKKLAGRKAELEAMKAARHAHEAAILQARREEQQRKVQAFMRTRAAKVLQTHWRGYTSAKKKAAKANPKGKKGKK